MKITCCEQCAEALRGSYLLTETGSRERLDVCRFRLPEHRTLVRDYEATPKKQARRRTEGGGRGLNRFPYKPKDTRAKAREPFRDW